MKQWRMMVGLMLVALTACGGGGGATSGTSAGAPAASGVAAASGGTTANFDSSGGGGATASPAAGTVPASEQAEQPQQQGSDRLVIRTATQQMLVENVDTVEARIRQIAVAGGGYVLRSESSGEGQERYATITIKVLAERFDDTLTMLSELGRIEAQQLAGQDVTDEFVDLQSRLRNLRTLEARLLQFLEESTNVEDSLRVSQELSKTQGEIEQTQGRIEYLQKSAEFATITISLRGNPVVALASESNWSPVRTARAALQGVIGFGQAIVTLLIIVAVWLPVWGPLALLGVWLWRRSNRLPVIPS
jgi:two-component sensor histidine kinase